MRGLFAAQMQRGRPSGSPVSLLFPVKHRPDRRDEIVDVGFGGVAAHGDAQRTVGGVRVDADGTQHVAGLKRMRAARRSARDAEAAHVEA